MEMSALTKDAPATAEPINDTNVGNVGTTSVKIAIITVKLAHINAMIKNARIAPILSHAPSVFTLHGD